MPNSGGVLYAKLGRGSLCQTQEGFFVPNSVGVLCAKLGRGSLFQRAIPAFTSTGPCKAWSVAVANESSLY